MIASTRSLASGAVLLLATAGPSLATGGLNCEIDDPAMSLMIEAGFSYSIPGLFNPRGTLDVRNDALPKSLRQIAIAKETLVQYWLSGNELKLNLYKETEGAEEFALVDVVIETTRPEGEDFAYEGRYVLKVQLSGTAADGTANIVTTEGKVTCSAG